jgi:hypothetical protein
MRITWLPEPIFKGIAVVLVALMFSIPVASVLHAQDTGTACMEAERQARSDISGMTWFLIGCVAGPIGYLIAMSEPNPPSTFLLGKSPEYVALFTSCYRAAGKSIKTKNALYGCLVAVGVQAIFWIIYFVLIYEATETLDDWWYY